MKTTVKNTDNLFNGQEFYLGLDVHKKNFKVQIRNQGRELKRFTMDPEPAKLGEYMRKNYPGGLCNFFPGRYGSEVFLIFVTVINGLQFKIPQTCNQDSTK